MNKTAKGFTLAGIAATTWGTYGTFVYKLSGLGFSEMFIAAFSSIMLIIYFLISALIRNPASLIPTKKLLLAYIISGLIGVLGTNLCYISALSAGLSVAVASVITFTNYFLVMMISRFIWKVKITPRKIMAGIMALAGIFLLLQVWTDLSFSLVGLLLIIIVTMTFAISYNITSYALNNLGGDPDAFYLSINAVGLIILSFIIPPWVIVSEIVTNVTANGLVAVLVLLGFSLIPMSTCYFCLGRSFLYISPPLVVIMFSLDPIVASILGVLVLDQALTAVQILGIAIIISALIWLQTAELKQFKADSDIPPNENVQPAV